MSLVRNWAMFLSLASEVEPNCNENISSFMIIYCEAPFFALWRWPQDCHNIYIQMPASYYPSLLSRPTLSGPGVMVLITKASIGIEGVLFGCCDVGCADNSATLRMMRFWEH